MDATNDVYSDQPETEMSLAQNEAHSSPTGSGTRGQGLNQGSLPRGQGSLGRTRGVGSLTRRQVSPELLPVASEICQRDTRVFAALFIVVLLLQVLHTITLTRRNVKSHKDLGLDTESSIFNAAKVLFIMLIIVAVLPAIVWLLSNAWEFCQDGIWAKLKRPGGFIAYHVSVGLSTLVYVSYLVYLMAANYNVYLDRFSTNATCYCLDLREPASVHTEGVYQCRCYVPDEATPWLLSASDLDLIDDASLQKSGSNYTGYVTKQAFNSSHDLFLAEEGYFPEFKKLVYCMQLSVLTIGLRVMCWGWTSDYAGRDMTHLDSSITVPYLRDQRTALLHHSLYSLLEGVDLYCLFTDLMDRGRQLASDRSMADGVMAVIGLGSYLVHLLFPFAFVRCFPSLDRSTDSATRRNKFLAFVSSLENTILAMKLASVLLNLMLLTLRLFLFRMLGGFEAVLTPNLFLLLVLKEFYVIWQKGSEFCIGWWDLQREEHYDDD